MRCNDCGNTIKLPSKIRSDVCADCEELRYQFVQAMRTINQSEFREVQRVLASGNGQGANAMRRVLGLCGPEI